MTRQALFAVAMVLAMVGAPLTGAVAADSTDAAGNLSVGVAQDDDEVTVSVTRNDTGVTNASVLVETAGNGTYAGAGNDTTDDDGEAELPAPTENVTVDVTAEAGNDTATTTAELAAVEENETDENGTDSFGQRVSAYVHALQDDENVTRIGPLVAAFVTANTPGNAPDHAGPPAHAGPPGDRSDDADSETDDEGNETVDGSDEGDERGPPAHAGPPGDRGDDDGGDDAEEEEEREEDGADDSEKDDEEEAEDDDEKGEDDDERGPPEGAGPPDHAGR